MIKRQGLRKRIAPAEAPAPKFTFEVYAGVEKLGSFIEASADVALVKARKKFGAPEKHGVFEYTAKRV